MLFAGAASCFESVIDVLAYNDLLLEDQLGLKADWRPHGAAASGASEASHADARVAVSANSSKK
jgi:hypothetical protein